MKENIYKLLHTNPEFEYYLYSDINSLTFIKDNYPREVTEAFETLKPGAYKSDLWRYCILYITGGVYIDIKFYSIVPLIDIIKKNPIIYVKDMPYSCGSDYGLYNGFMVSPPKNEIFKLCIDDIVNSCKFKLYKSNGLSITGPCLLGEIVRKNESQAYMDALEFNFGYISYVASFWDRTIIRYNDTIIFKVYEEYRNEQKQFQVTEHYGDMWANSMVYN
jgi:mannosyltransferase OCH1-like enzyme